MTRLHYALLPVAIAALLLAGCASGGDAVTAPPADSDASQPAAEPETEPETGLGSGYSAGPECDAYATAKNAGINEANQQAVQVSVDELPFSLPNQDPILCVLAIYTLDVPEDRPLGFELAVNAINGEGYNAFAMSPDLTYVQCATASPNGCFTDTFGNIVVVGGDGSEAIAPYFPSAPSFMGVGVHTVAEYRNS